MLRRWYSIANVVLCFERCVALVKRAVGIGVLELGDRGYLAGIYPDRFSWGHMVAHEYGAGRKACMLCGKLSSFFGDLCSEITWSTVIPRLFY